MMTAHDQTDDTINSPITSLTTSPADKNRLKRLNSPPSVCPAATATSVSIASKPLNNYGVCGPNQARTLRLALRLFYGAHRQAGEKPPKKYTDFSAASDLERPFFIYLAASDAAGKAFDARRRMELLKFN